MSDEILSAPVRLIAFHSGKYDYAEVRLDAPLHLMGANNIGKTSLIAMLQFLYLDDQRKMHFSHQLSETRKYYFPDIYSYVLFECRTPEGMAVVGVHGLGPARQYEFERFSYRGRFDEGDFLTKDRQPRDSDDVKARLAGKSYTRLEPKHVRAALSGVGEDRGVRLGLVPLSDRGQYDRFSFLFCNLLRLAQLRQDELKELLVEIYSNEFQQKKIDLSVDYRERFNRLQREVQALKDLRWIEKDVAKLLDRVDKRDAARGALPALWKELGRQFTARDSELEKLEQEKQEEYSKLQNRERVLKEERSTLHRKRDELNNDLGGLKTNLRNFQALEKSLEGFISDWAKNKLEELQKVTSELQSNITRLEGERVEQIESRIERYETNRNNAIRLRDSGEHLLLAKLRKEYRDEDIEQLFQVLNPSLLHLDESAVEVKNPATVRERLNGLLGNLSDNSYADSVIRIDLHNVTVEDITALTDPAVLTMRIEELDRQILHETSLLAAARDREGFEKKLAEKRKEETTLNRRLMQWEDMCRQRESAESWKTDIQSLNEEAEELRNQTKQIDQTIQSIGEEGRTLLADAAVAGNERKELLEKQHHLSPPKEDWTPGEGTDFQEEFDDLYEHYQRTFNAEFRFAEEVEVLLSGIQDRTYERYNGQTERKTLQRLKEAVDALETREEALHKSWADFAVSLRSSFTGLSRDLERLEGRVRDLNRRMGNVAVSNLDAVKLIISEHSEWTKRMKTLQELHDDLPLFSETEKPSGEMVELGHLLEQVQSVGLYDLFDLQFVIQGSDGKERHYSNLDKIESNGTTITIKVLVHLILLRDLMSGGKAHIPFYLDEVSSLDHANIAGIIQLANSQGFIPVLASPDSVEEVDRIYVLAENPNGRIVLDEKALIELRRVGNES